jgi:hypothetical protein
LVVGYIKRDFTWFARCGALLVGFGILLVSRTAITGRELLPEVINPDLRLNKNSPAYWRKLGQPVPYWVAADVAARTAMGILGPIISFLGTVIWGFGDLLNHWIDVAR